MSIVESVKAVMWARKRQPEDVAILSADPQTHVRRIKAMQAMGATAVVVMNISGADPLGTVRLYGDHVLPALRGSSG
jgi:coenzyme F420-dependent glucose-6-phosphate dehydrogenase